MKVADSIASLAAWYRDLGRKLIADQAPDRIEDLDRDLARLEALSGAGAGELPVCFLGNSGVGKSTLLNAMVGGRIPILPAGGIGPLTAQATVVRYATDPYFKASYLSRQVISNMLFVLERQWEAELRSKGDTVGGDGSDLDDLVTDDVRADKEVEATDTSGERPVDSYARVGVLLIEGNQFADIDRPSLMDSLRACLGRAPRWGSVLRPENQTRIEGIRRALELAQAQEEFSRNAGTDLPAFLRGVKDHASGYLAPLIRTLEVGWDAQFLRPGLVLVDLPGLGVANDEYRRVTANWIRSAKAVVLVVDRAGVAESSAELLNSTGFLTSLLHDADVAQADRPILIVAVVKLDLSADDAERETQIYGDETASDWAKHFDEVCHRADGMVKAQLDRELRRIVAAGGESTREERERIIAGVLSSLKVVPVAPTEFRHILINDRRARLDSLDATRVPSLVNALSTIAILRQQGWSSSIQQTSVAWATRCRTTVQLVIGRWSQKTEAEEDVSRIRGELETLVAPLRSEFLVRQGQFREFIRSTVPTHIEARVADAANHARKDLHQYLRKYSSISWATLRAAIRRGGAFKGASNVDLPNELTLLFEEPVAIVWRQILSHIRRETSAMANDYVRIVGEIVEWSRREKTRVQARVVEALHEELQAAAKDLAMVGKEAIDELRARVKTQLFEKVEERVRKRCDKFVTEGKDRGIGVKLRMGEFLSELSDVIIDAAVPVAIKVLTGNYEQVALDIGLALRKHRNPVDTAVEEIISHNEERIRKTDARVRKRILDEANRALEAMPAAGEGSPE